MSADPYRGRGSGHGHHERQGSRPVAWMRLLAERRTTQRQAAEALGLTARHLRRLYAAFQAAGAPGLVSKLERAARPGRLS
jgi:hypothetical protein